jgi:serine O-acetyltransferase
MMARSSSRCCTAFTLLAAAGTVCALRYGCDVKQLSFARAAAAGASHAGVRSSSRRERSVSMALSEAALSSASARAIADVIAMGSHSAAVPPELWQVICEESRAAAQDPAMSAMLHGSVLSHRQLQNAIAAHMAPKLATAFVGAMEVASLMSDMFEEKPELVTVMAQDLLAHTVHDPSRIDALSVLLYHKGYHALLTYRLSHWLWTHNRKQLARFFQSVCSEVCAADIHPAARIGRGVFVAGGSNIVIGETARVGDNVCILQGVTLGGTGKSRGDRHPKVGSSVIIRAGASVLGNIVVGEGARIEACSVVTKDVIPYTLNKGVPSKPAGYLACDVNAQPPVGVQHAKYVLHE